MTWTWEDLAATTLARQFPLRPATVAGMAAAIGPMQTQAARAAYLGLASRFPGVTHAEITRAYDDAQLLRGSTIRGTVHTAARDYFPLLTLATRIGQRRRWTQLLKLPDDLVDDLWASIEAYAAEWRTPAELQEHLADWLTEHHPDSVPLVRSQVGRYLAFGQGALVRRPASGAGWEGQGPPVYRRHDVTTSGTLADVVRLHLCAHGPATRKDFAWWSGLPLRAVDEAVDRLGLVGRPGPDQRSYLDVGGLRTDRLDAVRATGRPLVEAPAGCPVEQPVAASTQGVRLLPEFDALLCAYEPASRGRFVTPELNARLWGSANGLMLPPLLVDGRITGWWRMTGSAKRRPLEVNWSAGTRTPRTSELEAPIAALEEALSITVSGLTLTRV